MTLAIIAGIVFLAHVAIWLGVPTSRVSEVKAAELVAETV